LRLLAALLLVLAGAAAAQNTNDPINPTGPRVGPAPKSEWELREERNRPIDAVALPAWPANADLIEFQVNNTVSFRFFIDAASLTVGPDHVVRYTLIARSPSGVANVSFEGMRCADALYTVYAYGQDGKWQRSAADWRPIEFKPTQNWHFELRARYFCPQRRGTIFTAAEGIDALKRGGHPGVAARPGY
jgi:hypothetical protein